MARVFTARFKPFTYNELATPLVQATEAHQAQEAAYDQLITDADKMKAFLNEDWQSYKDYKAYVDSLNEAADDLAKHGLTRENRGMLYGLKRDYNGKIQAINAGILSRQDAIEKFNSSPKGQSSRYIGARPEDYSVDEYMYGNNPFKVGVDGSEIYAFSHDQAKASTSRRYQEYTEGGKWRISEMGVDPFTTQAILDALENGTNLEEYYDLAQKNPRQFQYMQSVLHDMRDIYNNAQETYGYNRFSQFDDDGDEVPTSNSMRFNTEIINGINAGIQYERKSEADPYAKMAYQDYLTRRAQTQTENTSSHFGLLPVDYSNDKIIKARELLGMRKNEQTGEWEQDGITIDYNGEKIHFDSKLDAFKWANQNENLSKLEKEESRINHKYGKSGLLPLSINGMADVLLDNLRDIIKGEDYQSFGEFYDNIFDKDIVEIVKKIEDKGLNFGDLKKQITEDYDTYKKIQNQKKEFRQRQKTLKEYGYDLSKSDYKKVSKAYGFNPDEEYDMDDIKKLQDLSLSNNGLIRLQTINAAPVSGSSRGSNGDINYSDDKILEKMKNAAVTVLQRRASNEHKRMQVYDVSQNNLQAYSTKRNKNQVYDIIRGATSAYTTLELMMHNDGINEDFSYAPIIVFQGSDGEKVGVSMANLGPSYENFAKLIEYELKNNPYKFTDKQNRPKTEKEIAEGLYVLGQQFK